MKSFFMTTGELCISYPRILKTIYVHLSTRVDESIVYARTNHRYDCCTFLASWSWDCRWDMRHCRPSAIFLVKLNKSIAKTSLTFHVISPNVGLTPLVRPRLVNVTTFRLLDWFVCTTWGEYSHFFSKRQWQYHVHSFGKLPAARFVPGTHERVPLALCNLHRGAMIIVYVFFKSVYLNEAAEWHVHGVGILRILNICSIRNVKLVSVQCPIWNIQQNSRSLMVWRQLRFKSNIAPYSETSIYEKMNNIYQRICMYVFPKKSLLCLLNCRQTFHVWTLKTLWYFLKSTILIGRKTN